MYFHSRFSKETFSNSDRTLGCSNSKNAPPIEIPLGEGKRGYFGYNVHDVTNKINLSFYLCHTG